ncbi:aspartyl-tRNA amidotransferase subunit B [Bacteroidota bacterium]|nr:aspartyl-tRNA amidotransferase subunit B [Bacteroidota bacterium]
MALEQQIMTELKAAMLAKDEAALRSLRAIKAAILLAKTSEGAAGELSADGEIKLLQKMVKQRKDSLEIFTQQGREDLAKKEREEIAVIEKFLPQQMDPAAVRAVLVQLVAQAGASSPADMGKVMGLANKELAGKAEGKLISTIVRELLSGQ